MAQLSTGRTPQRQTHSRQMKLVSDVALAPERICALARGGGHARKSQQQNTIRGEYMTGQTMRAAFGVTIRPSSA
jgi:hypothetical protein